MKFGFKQLMALAASALALASCGKSEKHEGGRAEAAPRQVRVARAESRPLERTLGVVGTLAAHDEATVAAQVAGQIEQLSVDVGDRVTARQELALIDTTSYEAFARQSAANLAKATAASANAERSLKRIQELQQNKIASGSDLDQAIADSAQAQAEVKSAEASDAIARLNLQRSHVTAPFDGAVAARVANAGNYVAIGSPIIRLVKTDPLRLRLDVPERESLAVRTGQTVRVTVEGSTNVYIGQISRVAPAIRESDRMLQVEADVPNRGALRASLFARAQIVVNEREPAVCVPAGALTTFAGLEKVVVLKEGKAVEKTVTTGRRDGDWVEILSGLAAGETVVLNATGLRTGQPVLVENRLESSILGKPSAEGAR